MPAPNIETLLDFEGQFEIATQAIMTANGITSYISEQTEQLPLLNTGIDCNIEPALDTLLQIPAPSNWPANREPPMEYSRYVATLELRVEVPRDANAATVPGVDTLMAQIRAKVRAAMLLTVRPFTDTNLPYYVVSDIRPNGTTTGFEGVRNVDFVALRFRITFQIRPSAWPAWVIP